MTRIFTNITENRAYAIRPYETETTPEAGVEAKLVLTIPCKKEFFYEVKKLKTTKNYEQEIDYCACGA